MYRYLLLSFIYLPLRTTIILIQKTTKTVYNKEDSTDNNYSKKEKNIIYRRTLLSRIDSKDTKVTYVLSTDIVINIF